MKKLLYFCLYIISFDYAFSQGNPDDYYYEIPEVPEFYNEGTVAARIVDGLGFRYYWASEGLREEDLKFRPAEGSRSIEETIDHIFALSKILVDAVNQQPYEQVDLTSISFEEKREMTLENIKNASEILKKSTALNFQNYNMTFSSTVEYPFWNLLNGPIADAINHVGQIISFRRTNGNPFNQNISVLRGKVKN
ncbi:hypothetical protein [Ekhidna sp.]